MVVILGGGQAGASAAVALRQLGYEKPITIICEEPYYPYQRPPLSKAYFSGDIDAERLQIRPPAWYQTNDVNVLISTTAELIDTTESRVTLDNGTQLDYDHLIIATGSRARELPIAGAELGGVLTLRTLADVDKLKAYAQQGCTLGVVGGGYIGLETAAVAKKIGMNVIVFEAAERLLARVAGPELAGFIADQHRARDIEIRLNARITGFVGNDNQVSGIKMADGEVVPVDAVLVGIGILPNSEIAHQAGIDTDNGVVTDQVARTSVENIFAIGDCASRPIEHYHRIGRLESVHNALEQAKLAACAIVDKPRPAIDIPWFWSDQFDVKLQTAGLLTGYDQTVVRGSQQEQKFSIWYLQKGELLAVDAINAPVDFMMGKKLAGRGIKINAALLADVEMDIKQITKDTLANLGA